MREGSALLERLERRFESVENRADRRSEGMRKRDSFLSHFSDRMRELESLVQVPEMSAFRRLPKIGKSFDPWGNMGGWSAIQDLVYLDWIEEQEEEEEEFEQPRVSAWGTATSSSDRRQSSAWLNTPYTPARVAGKPLPQPQSRSTKGNRPVKRERRSVGGGLPRKRRTAEAPTLSPLNRVMGRAAIAEQRRSSQSRVMNSLPPMLAQTTGKRWMASQSSLGSVSNRIGESRDKVRPPRKTSRSSLRSPMVKMLAQEFNVGRADTDLTQSTLASQRLTQPKSSSLLSRDVVSPTSQTGNSRGLRSTYRQNVPVNLAVDSASTGINDEMAAVIRRQVVKAIAVSVPNQVTKTVKRTLKNIEGTGKASTANISKEVTEIIERFVFKEAQSQIEDVLRSASIGSLEQLVLSTGTRQSAIRRVNTIVTDIVKQIVVQAQKNGVVERTVRQRVNDPNVTDNPSVTVLTQKQKRTIVQRLQAKGIRRQITERLLESGATSQQDILSSVNEIVSLTEGAISQKALERRVRRELNPLIVKSAVTNGPSKSILPPIAGEHFAERIIADVVNEITSYADRETLVENSEGQRQLMNSLERTVSKLVGQTRSASTPDFDWVDAVAQNQDVDVEGNSTESTSSPWFTRVEDSSQQKGRTLQPMQQAATRVLRMVSENPTRPEVIARQTGLNIQEVQQLLSSIQGFQEPTQASVTQVLRMVSDNSTRPEVIARQTGLKVTEVQDLVSKFSGRVSDKPLRTAVNASSSLLEDASSGRWNENLEHPLEKLWDRATGPIALPEWTGIGTSSFKPAIGDSAKGWRLSPKRRAVHPYAVDVDSTVLQPSNLDADNGSADEASAASSPWFSKKDADNSTSGFGFVPETISGDAKLSTNEIAMFGQAKSVQLSIEEVRGQQARWLEPNRTVVLDNGTVIHAKMAKRLGLDIKAASKQNLPLSWTLEGVQLKSDHKSLPTWAKRASGKPQVKASPEFLIALAKASSAEDVADVILQNAGRSQDGILPKTAMTAIDQIRRHAHSSLKDMSKSQQEIDEQSTLRTGRDRSRRRVSRTASAVVDGLTGLKPISTSGPSTSGAATGTDKVTKLAKQLESLVSLAENNRRDEAREGVRMAEDSHDAIAEGQSDAKGEERDYAVDIEALRQEVMRAFEQEMSIRSLRSFENSQNTDPWW